VNKWSLVTVLIFNVHVVFAQTTASNADFQNKILSRKIDFVQPKGRLEDALIKLSREQNLKISYSHNKIENVYIIAKIYTSSSLSNILSTLLLNTGFTFTLLKDLIVIVQAEKTTPVVHKPIPQKTTSNIAAVSESFPPGDSSCFSDTISPDLSQIEKVKRRTLFVSGSLGLINYTSRIKYHTFLPDDYKLGFTSTYSISPQFNVGVFFQNFIFQTGLRFQQAKILANAEALVTTGTGTSENVKGFFSANYFITSIPVEVLWYKEHKQFFAGIGASSEFQLINSSHINSTSLQTYYQNVVRGSIYSEKLNKLSFLASLRLIGGLYLGKERRTAIAGGLEFKKCLTPYYQNSLFALYPNSTQLEFSFFYFPAKAAKDRVIMH
jgi:hypothetical protein